MRAAVRGVVAVVLGAALVVGAAAPGGAASSSIPYTCETGVPAIGPLSAPIDVVTTATPQPVDVFQKVAYTADLSLPDIAPQPFALNFDFFRVTLDIPAGMRDVKVKIQDPTPAVANPAVSSISAVVANGQIVVTMPATPGPTRRFNFGTNGTFRYPFNTVTQSGGSAVVLPRIKVVAMPTVAAGGGTIDWTAPAVDTNTGFFGIGAIPCTPDDPSATILSSDVTSTVAIPLNPHTDVPGSLDAAVSWARHLKVFKVPTTRFSPSAPITRAEAVVALWNLVDRPIVGTGNPFTDVPANASYRNAVNWAFSEGVVTDTGNHRFKPTKGLNRGQLVQMAFRTVHAQEGSPWPAFGYTDVPAGAPYAEALRWADANGLVNEFSGGTQVRPTLASTRADLVRHLFRVANDPDWFRPLPSTVLVAPA